MTGQFLHNRLLWGAVLAAGLSLAACSAKQPAAPTPGLVETGDTSVRGAEASMVADNSAKSVPVGLVGSAWNFDYRGRRGTITYNDDGTFAYEQPGIGSGTGHWEMRGGSICQSAPGSQAHCVSFRQKGGTFYIGNVKLTPARG